MGNRRGALLSRSCSPAGILEGLFAAIPVYGFELAQSGVGSPQHSTSVGYGCSLPNGQRAVLDLRLCFSGSVFGSFGIRHWSALGQGFQVCHEQVKLRTYPAVVSRDKCPAVIYPSSRKHGLSTGYN